MCGIYFIIEETSKCSETYIDNVVKNASKAIAHRGPDSTNYKIIPCGKKTIIMVHTRLHVVGNSTPQPIVDDDIVLIINGEIFNWKELSEELEYPCKQSDCEIIIGLYKKYIREKLDFKAFFEKINGQFSFILYDKGLGKIFVSRDHIGITPMYYGYTRDKMVFCSEMKGLTSFIENIQIFNPRTYMYSDLDTIFDDIKLPAPEYLNYRDLEVDDTQDLDEIHKNIKSKLIKSVHKQLLVETDVEFGVLLSGGLDSSLVASIISKKMKETGKRVKTFSIGMTKNSSDLIASRKMAAFLNSEHYEFYFTAEEGLKSIRDTIWYIESYDTTTVRASTAMYLLTKKIKEKFPKLKVLFSGELSDEMLCYLYGSNAPDEEEFRKETVRLVSDVHLFDCLRANKSCMANGIEARVPFTDPDFVKYILKIPTKFKIFGKLNNYKTVEKQILRDAFNDSKGEKYLPYSILYRTKEAFSDGVSSHDETKENWIDSLLEFCEIKYSDLVYRDKIKSYDYNKPSSKEQLYYRELFCEVFKSNSNTSEFTVKFWQSKWCGDNTDPSARKHIKEAFQ